MQRCGNCFFGLEIPDNEGARVCRLFPPEVTGVETLPDSKIMITSHNPIVDAGHWCGQWRGKDMANGVSPSTVSRKRRRK